jgi:hypothetical protein
VGINQQGCKISTLRLDLGFAEGLKMHAIDLVSSLTAHCAACSVFLDDFTGFEPVCRTTVRAKCLACARHIQKNPGMLVPFDLIRHRAGQRNIMGRNFDFALRVLLGHFFNLSLAS